MRNCARSARIKALPADETGERWEPVTPRRTVLQRWESLTDDTARGELLRTLGARMIASKPEGGELIVSVLAGELFDSKSKLSGLRVEEPVRA